MNEPTVAGAVERIHQMATEQGMDLAPSDVAFIIATFLEVVLPHSESTSRLIDEVNSVRDE